MQTSMRIFAALALECTKRGVPGRCSGLFYIIIFRGEFSYFRFVCSDADV